MENFREIRLERQLKIQRGVTIGLSVILLLSVLGNLFLFNQKNTLNKEKEEMADEINMLVSDIQKTNEENSRLKAEINTLDGQIREIRENTDLLEEEIKQRDARLAALNRRLSEIDDLRDQLAGMEALREEYERIEDDRNRLLADMQELDMKLKGVENKHEILLHKTEQAAFLHAFNICVHNLRDRWLGRPVTMELARRVNRTTVSFEINGNIFVEPGLKDIYLLMIDPGGNIVNSSSETFSLAGTGTSSHYTEYAGIQYRNISVPMDFTIVHEERLESGVYFMEVYIDGNKAGSSRFLLE